MYILNMRHIRYIMSSRVFKDKILKKKYQFILRTFVKHCVYKCTVLTGLRYLVN